MDEFIALCKIAAAMVAMVGVAVVAAAWSELRLWLHAKYNNLARTLSQ